MAMVVRSNIMAVNANRQLGMNNSKVGKSLEKLASGFKINRAGDDASGLAISEKMKAQIKGLDTASSNSQDGISLIQTAEGALTEVHDMLNRMVELAGKAANGTMDTTVDRSALQKEFNSLIDEIDRIAASTNFNGIKLLDGSLGNAAGAAAGFTLTQPTGLGITETAAGAVGTAAVYDFDLAGMAATGAGDIDIEIGGKTYTIAAVDGDDDAALAAKLITAMNADALTDTAGGAYTATANATTGITLTAANQAIVTTPLTAFTATAKAPPAGVTIDTAPTATGITVVDGNAGAAATIDFDLAGMVTGGAGDLEFKFGDKTYTVAAAAGDDDEAIAAKLATAMNADPLTDADAGAFTAVATGSGITLTAANTAAIADPAISGLADFAVAPKAAGAGAGLVLQIGDSAETFDQVTVSVGDMSSTGLALNALKVDPKLVQTGGILDETSARAALVALRGDLNAGATTNTRGAINVVSDARADLGALQNRLEHTVNNLDVASENMNSANSRIRDTDMAKEMMEYTKMNVLTQAAQAMLAQANQQPQSVLQLLQ